MRRMRIVAACAVCLLAATGAASASAAKILELSTSEGLIAGGTQLNLGGTSSFKTPVGDINCPNGLLVATLLNNGGATDKIGINAGLSTGKNGIVCSTSTILGSVEIKAGGLPWTQQFASSGKAQLKGVKKMALTVTVPALGLQCTYEAKKITETFPLAADGVAAPLVLAVSNQAFVRSSTSGVLCPASIEADYSDLPVTVEGPSAELLPVSVTRMVVPRK